MRRHKLHHCCPRNCQTQQYIRKLTEYHPRPLNLARGNATKRFVQPVIRISMETAIQINCWNCINHSKFICAHLIWYIWYLMVLKVCKMYNTITICYTTFYTTLILAKPKSMGLPGRLLCNPKRSQLGVLPPGHQCPPDPSHLASIWFRVTLLVLLKFNVLNF